MEWESHLMIYVKMFKRLLYGMLLMSLSLVDLEELKRISIRLPRSRWREVHKNGRPATRTNLENSGIHLLEVPQMMNWMKKIMTKSWRHKALMIGENQKQINLPLSTRTVMSMEVIKGMNRIRTNTEKGTQGQATTKRWSKSSTRTLNLTNQKRGNKDLLQLRKGRLNQKLLKLMPLQDG